MGIFCTEVKGHFDVEVVDLLVRGYDDTLASSPGVLVRSFQDWFGITSYDSGARNTYTEDSKRVMGFVERIDILFSSRLVAMAVSVSNIVLGGKLHPVSDRAEFERRRKEALTSPRPPLP